jgi:hypothetical protein
MSILSSLLGITKGQPTQTIPTGVQTQEIAKEVAPFIKDILGKGQALYKQRTEEGFVPFEGKTLADVTAEQQQAQEGIRGLVGTQAPSFEEARGLVRGTTAKPTVEGLQEFMSPYQQAVIDVEKRRAQEAFERDTLPKVRQAQIASGAFGGTRGTLLEALALQDQARLLSDIEARGQQQAFESAQRAFEAQKQREAQAAQGLSGLAQTQFGQATRELGQLEAVGREQQQREQQLLDESYQRFLRERAFPEQQLAQYQGIVTGASPLIGTSTVQRTPQQFQPSPLASALGTAAQVADIYGTFSRANQPNLFSTKEGGPVVPAESGGGLSILIKMIRAQKGKGGDPRSKRSKEIRTRIQQEDVTDMLEAFEKSGLPTIKKADAGFIDSDVKLKGNVSSAIADYFGYGDPDKSTALGRLIGKEGLGALLTLPGRYLLGDTRFVAEEDKPTVLGTDITPGGLAQAYSEDLAQPLGRMVTETEEEKVIRKAQSDNEDENKVQTDTKEKVAGVNQQDLLNLIQSLGTSTAEASEIDLLKEQLGSSKAVKDAIEKRLGKVGVATESQEKLDAAKLANLEAMREEAQQDKMSALLRGLSKGLLSPKVGKGGFVTDAQQGLLEGQKELSKLKGADAKVRATEIKIFEDKVNKELQDETKKLQLLLAQNKITNDEFNLRIQAVKAANASKLLGIQLGGNKDTELKNAIALIDSGFFSDDKSAGLTFINNLRFQPSQDKEILKNRLGETGVKKNEEATNLQDADSITFTPKNRNQ